MLYPKVLHPEVFFRKDLALPIALKLFQILVQNNTWAYAPNATPPEPFSMFHNVGRLMLPVPKLGVGMFDNGMRRIGMGYGFNGRLSRVVD